MIIKTLIVQTVSDLRTTKYDSSYPYHYCTLKSIDDNDKTKYVLNIQKKTDKKGNESYKSWFNAAKPGAVLECTMQERNPKNVSMFHQFKIVKKASDAPKKVEEKSITEKKQAVQLILALELDKIENSINKLREDFGL